jgi:hypothetical protein
MSKRFNPMTKKKPKREYRNFEFSLSPITILEPVEVSINVAPITVLVPEEVSIDIKPIKVKKDAEPK